jgi:molecular chaperone Hsp33
VARAFGDKQECEQMAETATGFGAAQTTDVIFPFSVDGLDVRGRTGQFGAAIDAILNRHDYPAPVARLLAEAIALTALLGSSLKFDGKFIMQTQTDGPVNLLVADLRSNGALRGYARYDEDYFATADRASEPHQALLGKGVLAFTVDQGEYMQRYQGLVELTGQSLQDAAVHYFRQSEQLPTEIRMAVGKLVTPAETPHHRAHSGQGNAPWREEWRVGGIIAQFMPSEPERMRQADLPGGDAPEGLDLGDLSATMDDDSWSEAKALIRTIDDSELTDPTIGAERLLFRLFNQHDPRLFAAYPVRDECSCSRARIKDVLQNFSQQEREESVENAALSVTCEFCSARYVFALEEFEASVP